MKRIVFLKEFWGFGDMGKRFYLIAEDIFVEHRKGT